MCWTFLFNFLYFLSIFIQLIFLDVEGFFKIVKNFLDIVLMNKKKSMWPGIKGIGDFKWTVFVDVVIYNLNNLFAELIEVENWWISIKTNRMKLIAILKTQQNLL